MSNKVLIKLVVASGVLAMLLIFLGVNYVPRTSAVTSGKENAVNAAIYAGSDYIERHPSVVARPVNYAGSDYFERHLTDPRMNSYAGSDYFERHPSAVARPVNYAGSDYTERHPGNGRP